MSLEEIKKQNKVKLENEKLIVEKQISTYDKNARFGKENSDLEEPEMESIVESLETAQSNDEIKLNLEHYLKQINHALHNIQINKYGYCESCGKQIDTDRLEVDPSATLCLACSLIVENDDEAS